MKSKSADCDTCHGIGTMELYCGNPPEMTRVVCPDCGVRKEKLYKTAFFTRFNCYVSIKHARQDDDGKWIFTCEKGWGGPITQYFLREEELSDFCL